MLQALIPVLLLALLLAAPKRGGKPASKTARKAALLVLIWGVAALGISYLWNEWGLALVAKISGVP